MGSAGLCCPSAGCTGHREGPGAPSPSWLQPLRIPMGFHARGAKPGSVLCSLWFCSVRCKDLGDERMRRREAEDAPAFLPRARGRRGSWKSPRVVTILGGQGGRAGSEQPWAQPALGHSSVLAEARGVLQLPPPQVLTWNRRREVREGRGLAAPAVPGRGCPYTSCPGQRQLSSPAPARPARGQRSRRPRPPRAGP